MKNYEIKLGSISVDFSKENDISLYNNLAFSNMDINTAFLEIELLNRGRAINLDGYNIIINIVKENGNKVVTDCDIIDSEKGLIEIALTPQMLSSRHNFLEISLIKDNTQLISPIVRYRTTKSLISEIDSDDIEESNDYVILIGLIETVENLKEDYRAIVEELEVTQNDIDDILEMVGGL